MSVKINICKRMKNTQLSCISAILRKIGWGKSENKNIKNLIANKDSVVIYILSTYMLTCFMSRLYASNVEL